MNSVRPVFSITSHLNGKIYELIQTDANSGQGKQVLQIATNDEKYFQAQIPGRFTEFVIDQSNPSQTYKEAVMELCQAVAKGIEINALDAAQTQWNNGEQRTTNGLLSHSNSRSSPSSSNNNQLEVRQLVT